MTAEQYGDFEMRFEWKITPRRQQRRDLPHRHDRAVSVAHRARVSDPAQRRSQGRQESDHVGGIELRGERAGEGRHQAGGRMERGRIIAQGQPRRALAERREGRRIRIGSPTGKRASRPASSARSRPTAAPSAATSRCRITATSVWYRNLKIKPLNREPIGPQPALGPGA